MVGIDKRETFIVSTANEFLGTGINISFLSPEDRASLNKFFDIATCRTLYVQPNHNDDNVGLILTTEIFSTGGKALIFFKIKPLSITDENVRDLVQITSIIHDPKLILIQALRHVWAPILQSLGVGVTCLKKLQEDILGPKPPQSLSEEEDSWRKKYDETKKSHDKKVIGDIIKIIKNIRNELGSAITSRDGLDGIEDILEALASYVDDLWKIGISVYTEEKMKILLNIIGNEIPFLVEIFLTENCNANARVKDEAITNAATICEKWVSICERLTTLFWPHQSLHPWTGPTFIPVKCWKFSVRLRQTVEMRLQYRQLTRLLSGSERSSFNSLNLLESIDDWKIILSDDDCDIEWIRLTHKFEENLTPVEERVAENLKKQMATINNPILLVREFQKYTELLKRESMKQTLLSERETLLSVLNDIIMAYQCGPDTENLLNSPRILQEIQAARLAESKLNGLSKLVKELLNDLSGYTDAISKITLAIDEAESKRYNLVEAWIVNTKDSIVMKKLTLQIDSPVIELIGKRMMKVNYDTKLMALVKEARALSGLGIELPREIRDLVECADALTRRARALQQIANFHNTIGDRMIPSQRPLMLSIALELARAVQEQHGVIWSDSHAVDAYTNRLREFVRKFAQQNSELASKHIQLRDLVANLLKNEVVNLVGSQVIWKETLRKMRTIVDEVEAVYGNTKAWKLHWDRQLIKVLGAAYRAALPKIVRKLPEIRIELIYRDKNLEWRPPLEEIRAKLYSGIRRFLTIPLNFRGVGDQIDGNFSLIVKKNSHLFGGVYKEANSALASLEAIKSKWIRLIEPGKLDLECSKEQQAEEWEKAFKDAKQWAQEIGKLRGGEMKMYCFSIDTTTTRNDLESATRRYWEQLSSELRTVAFSRLVAVINFLSSAIKELDRRPVNVEEICLAYETHKRIEVQSSGIGRELEIITGLAKVMAAWTKEKLDGIFEAYASWDGLSDHLERHKTVVERRIEDTKINLRHRAIAFRDERERWVSRWTSKPEIITLDWLLLMRERWTSLEEQKDMLMLDCQCIDLKYSEIFDEYSDNLGYLEAELEAEEANCRFQEEFMTELEKQMSDEWSIARRRIPRLHDWLDAWEERIKTPKNDSDKIQEVRMKIDTFVGKKVNEIKTELEWVQLLRGDELAEEHWNELKICLKLETNFKDLTLGDLLKVAHEIKLNSDKVKEITKRAVAESGIRQALIEIESWETSASLHLHEAKDSKNVTILVVGEYADLLTRTDELKLLIDGAKGASGYERFAARAARCESALFELEERVKILGLLQRKWVYLEPVYSSGAAPNDSGRWLRADKEFRYLMNEVARNPKVLSLKKLPLPTLVSLKELLDKCQKSLDEFLEEKRSAYPRLYFLGDDDLLELLSSSNSGLNIHLPKLFHGVASVELRNGYLTSVISPEGEVLLLSSFIDISGPLPVWLKHLQDAITVTLSQSLEKCLVDTNPNVEFYPAQVLLLAERIRFTENCETALKNGESAIKYLIEHSETRRAKFRSHESDNDVLTAQKARSLLLETVYNLDVARGLLKLMENGQKTSWTWNRHLRCYKTNNGPIVKCAGAEFPYKFEYQGAAIGLVRTPLTERCFLALTQAMKLGLGGSPTGPAGTGKTESVKALAAILGRLVLVFNCDEGMDAESMKRILGGLAQAGAWGCFDEFNRLEKKTLSAVAMLVRPLQEAVRDNLTHVQLDNQNVKLDPHCCVFITMNPAGSDYGGRNKLPDSLGRLFRPIAMANPDRCYIVRALLECTGFSEAFSLARKLIETFDISEKLLSTQPHYDWGLRALRSVVDGVSTTSLSENENERLLNAIKSAIIPKLNEGDMIKFTRLLKDVFVNVDVLQSRVCAEKQELKKVLSNICDSKNLQADIVTRCEQLFDQLKSRTGVAIVGAPGSGKTLIRKILFEASAMLGEKMEEILIYPGAIPKSQLLGKIDPQTREWKDGLLSTALSANGDAAMWIVFDGDVEPSWVEALNSVLDDNRILTLSSGISIKLGQRIKFIFETHKLDDASPATISRLGVVHLANTQPTTVLSSSILDRLLPFSKNIAINNLKTIIESSCKFCSLSVANLIKSTFSHLARASTLNLVTYSLIMAICMQIGVTESRKNIAKLIYQSCDSWCPDPEKPFDVYYNAVIDRLESFGNESTIIQSDHGPISISNVMRRGLASIVPWIEDGHPVIIRGPNGSGRSSLISYLFTSLNDNIEASSLVYASSLFGPEDLINRLKRSCVRVQSSANNRIYRPRSGSKVILIIKEIHLATKNLQELIRELVQQGGFYDIDSEFAQMPVKLLSTADEMTQLHPRLNSLLAAHYLPSPAATDILTIVNVHLNNIFKNINILTDSWISNLAVAMYESLTAISSSEDSTFLWTTKDLCLWSMILKHYPMPEKEEDVTMYLIDIGTRLFYPRLSLNDQKLWMSTLIARLPHIEKHPNEIYIWRVGNSTLIPINKNDWGIEIENTASKCARQGEIVHATLTCHLLRTVAGINWALGCCQTGIILIGRPGSGRRSASKLASSYSSWRLIESAPGKARSSIKIAIQAAGIDGERTILLLEEHHARENGVAILIGEIVSKGEIPGLLGPEELDGLIAPLIDLARNEDFTGTLDQYLYHRLRKFLRVMVIVDRADINKDWLNDSRMINHCIYVSDTPGNEWWTLESSLTDLAIRKIPHFRQNNEDINSISKFGIKTLVNSHYRAPSEQQSPARFIALLDTWQELRNQWERDIELKLESLQAGIGKLKEAGDSVAKLENVAARQRKELEEEKKKAKSALEQITATMRGATGQRGEMSTLKANTERESVKLLHRKADIENELNKVKPLVEAASQAVAGIGADALAEVRSLRAPPTTVRDVLEGVLRLMGIRDTSWNSMKIFLAKRGVKDEIRNWDARRSSPVSLEAVAKLIKERPDSFVEKTARRASVAAAPLAAWVLANLQYGQILQQVAPLEREQRLLSEHLSAAEAQIDKLAIDLSSVESRVNQLQNELEEHSRGAAALQLRSEATEASLAAARSLLMKLDVEHSDWQNQFESLRMRKEKFGIEAAEAASLLVYQNSNKDNRWKQETLDLLVTERDRLIWRAQNLPADTTSLVGGICALRGPLVPLFMDSSGIAINWLKINLGNKLEITKPDDVKFITTLELAVRFGKPLLIEEIVELPTILFPLLRRKPLRLSEKTLPTQHGFKLFLATRKDTLDSLPSEVEAVLFKIALGTGTRSLIERFIEKALLCDMPMLEKQRREALELEERLSGERDSARLGLLAQLGAARGEELLQESTDGEHDSLLTSLEATQTKAKEIARALDESRRNREEISKRSKEHEKLAKFAANLFKAIKSLTLLNPLYVFSVEAFTDIYLESELIRKNLIDVDKKQRELLIENKLISLTLHYCTKAVFRIHRLPLALHLAFNLNPVPDIEKNLLQRGANLSTEGESEFEIPNWIPAERRSAVKALCSTLPEIASRLQPNWVEETKNIYKDMTLTTFQKVLVIQALRPDHLHTALTNLAVELLGVKSLALPTWTLEAVAQNTKKHNILLLLSPGADPGPELKVLASRQQLTETFIEVSLGQDHVEQAEVAIEHAYRNGGWVLLSNLQLALNWLPRLERILRSNNCTKNKNPLTRIWLTTEDCHGFYPGLAGICLKLAYEPPEGVKRNITRSIGQLQNHGPQSNNSEGMFVIAWLHAVLQERRRFIPQGWIRAYEWSEADLQAARVLVINHLSKLNPEGRFDWEEGRGLLDVAIYGGLLQDQYDMRTLDGILKSIWSRDVFHGLRKLGGLISVPEISKQDIFKLIDQLPDSDDPMKTFGLPANAVGAWERSAAETAITSLKNISIRHSNDAEKKTAKIAELKIQHEVKKLFQRYVGTLKTYSKSQNLENPIDCFFEDERELLNRLILTVERDVNNCSIFNSKTPMKWLEQWPSGPKEVRQFISALMLRNQYLSSLIYRECQSINLGKLTRPRAFIAALKQYTARMYNYPLDGLKFHAHWIDEISDQQSEKLEWKTSILLHGLFISGGLINSGKLIELSVNAAPISDAPRCQVAFLPEETENSSLTHELSDDKMEIPVYGDLHRNNFICSLPVGCSKKDQEDWFRRGVIIHVDTI